MSALKPLDQLASEMRACRRCAGKLSEYDVVPRPIFGGGEDYPILLIGQAPGKTEYKLNAPFQGDAGKSIKSLFESCGLKEFDKTVYQTSVTKCFPGRSAKARADRKPSVSEVRNCSPFLVRQIELLQPKLMVCLGGLAGAAYVLMREGEEVGYCEREFGKKKPSELRVPDLVGRRFVWKNIVIIPMIHPAGTANEARSKYPAEDRESKRLLREEIQRI